MKKLLSGTSCIVIYWGIRGFSSDFLSFGEVQGKYTRAQGPTISGFRVFFPFYPQLLHYYLQLFLSEQNALLASQHRELLEPHPSIHFGEKRIYVHLC